MNRNKQLKFSALIAGGLLFWLVVSTDGFAAADSNSISPRITISGYTKTTLDLGRYNQSFKPFAGRLAYSADGNYHDEDDIAANPFALMLLAESGFKDRLVHFEYGNHIWYTRPSQLRKLQAATMEAVKRFGFNPDLFFNCIEDRFAAYNHLKEQILASGSTNQLTIIGAGPMHTIYQALKLASQTDPEKLQYVTLVSHSPAKGTRSSNNEHGLYDNTKGKDPLHSHQLPEPAKVWDDIVKDFPTVKRVIMRSQNGPYDIKLQGYDFCVAYSNIQDQWMETSPNQNIRWVWENMKDVFKYKADVSDAGMVWYWLTGGDQYGNFDKVKQAFSGSYIVNENFNDPASALNRANWRWGGNVTVRRMPGTEFSDYGICMTNRDKKEAASVVRTFGSGEKNIAVDFNMMSTGDWQGEAEVELNTKSGATVIVIKLSDKGIFYKDDRDNWVKIGEFSRDKLHHIGIDINSLSGTCSVVLDGRMVKQNEIIYEKDKEKINQISFSSGQSFSGEVYFDNLQIFSP